MGMSIEEYRKIVSNKEDYKNPKYQLRGKVNNNSGKNFEKQIEQLCEIYEYKNIAKIEKTPEPIRILNHIENGRFEAVFTKSAQPDFKGTLSGGKTVVFDAKYTEANKISYQVLSDYQRESLLKYKKLGALAFVLVGFGNGDIYRIDIDIWNNMKEIFGRKYIKQEELEEYSIQKTKYEYGFINFLKI